MHMQLMCEGVVGGAAIVSGWLPHGQPSVASVLPWTMQKVDASFDPRNVFMKGSSSVWLEHLDPMNRNRCGSENVGSPYSNMMGPAMLKRFQLIGKILELRSMFVLSLDKEAANVDEITTWLPHLFPSAFFIFGYSFYVAIKKYTLSKQSSSWGSQKMMIFRRAAREKYPAGE